MNYSEQRSWEWGTQIRASNRFRQMQSPVSQQSNLIQCHGEKSDFSIMILDQLDIYIQFSSVGQSCPILCDPMNCSTPSLPVHHQLPESTQTHVHWIGDAIQPSHPLSSPSPPILNLSQHQDLFIGHLLTWGVHLSVSYLFAFHTVHGVLKARLLKWFAIPYPVDHSLSEPSTMNRPSWVALHSMA